MNWQKIIKQEQQKEYYKLLQKELDKEYKTTTVFPPKDMKNPPSMRNILKEIQSEFEQPSFCNDGDLTS